MMPTRRKRTSWEIQRSVVFALVMRELKTRFGSYRLGYVWALLEPLFHVAIFVIIFGMVMERTMPGVNYPLFIVTGIMPWLLFSNIVTRGMAAVSSNRALFSYRHVKPIDAVLARTLLEMLIQTAVFVLVLLLAFWIGSSINIIDPLKIIVSLGVLVLFSFGLALNLCIVATLYPEVSKFVPLILRPLYFVSGVFWSLNAVPLEYHSYLAWNPVLNVIEEVRASFFEGYTVSSKVSLGYVAMLAVIMHALGLSLYRQERERLIAT